MLYRSHVLTLFLLFALVLAACAPLGDPPTPTPIPPAATPLPPSPTVTAPPAPQSACPAAEPLRPLRYGINVFFFGTDSRRVARLSREAGFGWVRQQIHWRDIEGRAPRDFHWETLDTAVAAAEAQGLRVMLSVVRAAPWASSGHSGLPDEPHTLATFLQILARRYGDRVAAYEIWNEPNLAVENAGQVADPAHYLRILRAAYYGIKQIEPCAIVLAAPLAATSARDPQLAMDDLYFYRQLYAAEDGDFRRVADGVAVHPGGGPHPPEARWEATRPLDSRAYFRHVEAVRELMLQYDDKRPIWITEVGWSTWQAPGAPPPVSVEEQAAYLVGALEYARRNYPYVAGIFVWNLNFAVLGSHEDEKSTFGILAPDWSPLPAYTALQEHLRAGRPAADEVR
jgi:polysaccharide biosynthesis protein PslG